VHASETRYFVVPQGYCLACTSLKPARVAHRWSMARRAVMSAVRPHRLNHMLSAGLTNFTPSLLMNLVAFMVRFEFGCSSPLVVDSATRYNGTRAPQAMNMSGGPPYGAEVGITAFSSRLPQGRKLAQTCPSVGVLM
jgi:hypothetical protein